MMTTELQVTTYKYTQAKEQLYIWPLVIWHTLSAELCKALAPAIWHALSSVWLSQIYKSQMGR